MSNREKEIRKYVKNGEIRRFNLQSRDDIEYLLAIIDALRAENTAMRKGIQEIYIEFNL